MEVLISPWSRRLKTGNKNPKNYPYWAEVIDGLRPKGCRIVQVGQEGEERLQNVDEFLFNRPLSELKERIRNCAFWMSVDNFFPHLARTARKQGVVLWGPSDPSIFGYPENINIARGAFRPGIQQYWIWEQWDFTKEAFVESRLVLKTISEAFLSAPAACLPLKKKLSVSVVIPTFNREQLLRTCIDSILKHTSLEDKDLEIVVVSNGCKDGTVEYCRSISRVKVLEFPDALGYTKAINIGVTAARGEYVVLLNNDTKIHGKLDGKDWIDCLHEPFQNQTMVGATGAKKLHQFGVDFLVGFVLMIRKQLFQDFGMFDEIYNPGFGEEIDFSRKLQAKGYEEVTVDMPLSHISGQTVHRPEYRTEWEEHVLKNSKILEERYGYSQWQ